MGGNVRAQQPRLWARGKKEGAGSWRGTRMAFVRKAPVSSIREAFAFK